MHSHFLLGSGNNNPSALKFLMTFFHALPCHWEASKSESRQELVEQDFRCRDGIQASHPSPLVPSSQDAGVGIPETMQALDVACLKNMRVIQTLKPFDGG